jgi:hypothetical protein
MFAQSLSVRTGSVVERDGFVFADVALDEETPPAQESRTA